jgi:3D (Asp-Asp-Asp) domain-containing protein
MMSVNFFSPATPLSKIKDSRPPAALALACFLWILALFMSGCAQVEGKVTRHSVNPTYLQVRTTAYTHTEPGGSNNAIGSRLRFGSDVSSASADWSWLPVGTRFRIAETGRTYVIEDYGSALVGNKTVDLYMPNMAMMRAWGVKTVHIEILEWGSRPMSKMLLETRKKGETVRKMLSAMDREQ